MKLQHCRIFAYRLPLRRPLVFRRGQVHVREGLLLCLRDADGREGWGEIAPLPYWHQETLAQALKQWQTFWPSLQQKALQPAGLQKRHAFPSVQFAVESAWCQLQALASNQTLADFFHPQPAKQLALIGLLQGSPPVIQKDAAALLAAGYQSFKLKVGASVAADLSNLEKTRSIIGMKSRLVLDANRAWPWNVGLQMARRLADFDIDYIEEPLRDPVRLPDFYRETGLHYAWDETLQRSARLPQKRDGLKALVIKPGLTSGLHTAWQHCQRAGRWKVRAVISSAYESGLGLSILAHLAAAAAGTTGGSAFAGLDTWRWLARDVVQPPFQPRQGQWRLTPLPQVDVTRVREVWRG